MKRCKSIERLGLFIEKSVGSLFEWEELMEKNIVDVMRHLEDLKLSALLILT